MNVLIIAYINRRHSKISRYLRTFQRPLRKHSRALNKYPRIESRVLYVYRKYGDCIFHYLMCIHNKELHIDVIKWKVRCNWEMITASLTVAFHFWSFRKLLLVWKMSVEIVLMQFLRILYTLYYTFYMRQQCSFIFFGWQEHAHHSRWKQVI